MEKIMLHPKFGVNPIMTQCYFCLETKDILLVGVETQRFRDAGINVSEAGEMPHMIGVLNGKPCERCKEWMKKGIILISIQDNEGLLSDDFPTKGEHDTLPNPYRTGGWCVVKDDFIRSMCSNNQALMECILKRRFAFVEDEVWKMMRLPNLTLSAQKKDA